MKWKKKEDSIYKERTSHIIQRMPFVLLLKITRHTRKQMEVLNSTLPHIHSCESPIDDSLTLLLACHQQIMWGWTLLLGRVMSVCKPGQSTVIIIKIIKPVQPQTFIRDVLDMSLLKGDVHSGQGNPYLCAMLRTPSVRTESCCKQQLFHQRTQWDKVLHNRPLASIGVNEYNTAPTGKVWKHMKLYQKKACMC